VCFRHVKYIFKFTPQKALVHSCAYCLPGVIWLCCTHAHWIHWLTFINGGPVSKLESNWPPAVYIILCVIHTWRTMENLSGSLWTLCMPISPAFYRTRESKGERSKLMANANSRLSLSLAHTRTHYRCVPFRLQMRVLILRNLYEILFSTCIFKNGFKS
jgi:hypothetical protein